MWIEIPVLKNNYTNTVGERDLNMDHCVSFEEYVHPVETEDPTARFEHPDDERNETARRYEESMKPMKTRLTFSGGGELWDVYSPWDRDKIYALMRRQQALAVTPVVFNE